MANSNLNNSHDDISLRELILLGKEYCLVLWKRKLIIVIAGIIVGIIFTILEYNKPTTYTAELTFMVNEDEGNSLGGAAAILGQFGFGGAGTSEYNLEKIQRLSKSRKIAKNVLFDSLILDGSNDLVANHLIGLYEFRDLWEESDSLNGFLFNSKDDENFTITENAAMMSVLGRLIGAPSVPGIFNLDFEESTSILTISATSLNPYLSIDVAESMYEELSQFYIQQSTEKQQFTLSILEDKADSIMTVLNKAEYDLAKIIDNSKGFRLRTTQLKEQQLNREIQIVTLAYGEILKNKATAEFLLETARPFFQVIDRPKLPIDGSKKRYSFKLIYGLIIGGVLSSLIISLEYYFRNMFQN